MVARRVNRNARTFSRPVPAPVGGWNRRDALSAMPPEDAIRLDNADLEPAHVASRPGYVRHATTVGAGNVETLFELWSGSHRAFLASGSTAIYNVSSAGTSGTLLKGGFTGGGRWSTVNALGTSIWVDSSGTDWPQETSDGSSVSSMAGGAGFHSSAANESTLLQSMTHVGIWKDHVLFTLKNSQTLFYGGIGAIAGSVQSFPLGLLGKFGGHLIGGYSWSIDSGDGPDDLLVLPFTSGDVAIYQGIDFDIAVPNTGSMALIGTYRIGEPLDARAIVQFGGDIIIVSKQGYLPLSEVIREGQVAEEFKALSNKIRGEVHDVTLAQGASTGWEVVLHPRGHRLIFNVPSGLTQDPYHQHVWHPEGNGGQGGWTRYRGIPARTIGKYSGELYYGGTDGTVWKQGSGQDNGNDIQMIIQQAWDYHGDFARMKNMHVLEPLMSSQSNIIRVGIGLAEDFDTAVPVLSDVTAEGEGGAFWDVGAWDDAKWAGGDTPIKFRVLSGALGNALSLYLRTTSSVQTRFLVANYNGEYVGSY